MSKTVDDPDKGEELIAEPLRRALGDRYLTYALSTIMHRALPDARDGLKPVHRRILFVVLKTPNSQIIAENEADSTDC